MATIRHIYAPDGERGSDPILYITRFWGGTRGVCLQLTIGERFVQLDAAHRAEMHAILDELFDPPSRWDRLLAWWRQRRATG